jgi:hypothetical protein
MTLKGLLLGQVEQRLGGMTERRAKRNGLATLRPRLVAQAPQAPQCLAGHSHPPHRLRAMGSLQLPRPPQRGAAHHQPAARGGGSRVIQQPEPHPAAIHPRRLELDADGERGSHGKPGRAEPQRPHRGHPSANPTGSLASLSLLPPPLPLDGRGRHLRVVPPPGNGDTPWDRLSVPELRALLRKYPIESCAAPSWWRRYGSSGRWGSAGRGREYPPHLCVDSPPWRQQKAAGLPMEPRRRCNGNGSLAEESSAAQLDATTQASAHAEGGGSTEERQGAGDGSGTGENGVSIWIRPGA